MKTVHGEINYQPELSDSKPWRAGVVVKTADNISCPGWDEYVATREEAIELATDMRDDYIAECEDQGMEVEAGDLEILRDNDSEVTDESEEVEMSESTKEVKVEYGDHSATVQLIGFTKADRLTPKLARAALRTVNATEGHVWELAQWSDDLGDFDYDAVYGYRVYAKSARKVYA